MEPLRQKIVAELSKEKGVFAVVFKEIDGRHEIRINDTLTYHAASTMKTPVMAEVYREVAEGKIRLDDPVLLKNEFKSLVDGSPYSLDSTDDSETDLYKHLGETRPVKELLFKMIAVSSNFSTNLIMEKVGAKNVTCYMEGLGATGIHVLRGVEDGKAFALGMNNTVTARGLAVLFEKLGLYKIGDKATSTAMLDILSAQHFSEIIPAGCPPGTKVAHKTGSITGVQHDSGIVYMPDGRKYVLVILSKNLEDEKSAIPAMARVSKMIWDYMSAAK
ncbi:MAG TPA: serine hydrolase [Chitinophagaceae bacterium]|nr:serine hydrolase [Chitinophagaceae bacterium]